MYTRKQEQAFFERNFSDALETVVKDGGGTFGSSGLNIGPRTTGYFVGGRVPTEMMAFDFEQMSAEDKMVVVRGIVAFMNANYQYFGGSENGNNYIGLWLDKGTLYVDVSQYVFDRDEAIRLGKERGELSIYDNAAKDVLWLNEGVA